MRQRRYPAKHGLRALLILGLVVAACLLQACGSSFELGLEVDGQPRSVINQETWQTLAKEYPEALRQGVSGRQEALALEQVLWSAGVLSLESIQIDQQVWPWRDIHADSWLQADGRVLMGGQVLDAERLSATQPWEAGRATNTICDLTPTLAGALGVRSPQATSGRALGGHVASRVVVISVDGLGARFFDQHRDLGILTFMDSLGDPRMVQGMYPACSAVNLAALLTGAKPDVNGIRGEQDDALVAETLLDTLAEAGLTAVLLSDGAPTSWMTTLGVQNVEDADGNGARTEELVAQAQQMIAEQDAAFIWLNFADLYQRAQDQGPETDAAIGAALLIDRQLERLVVSLPSDSLVVIVGTHGMHATADATSAACGTLLPEDMYVPLWLVQF